MTKIMTSTDACIKKRKYKTKAEAQTILHQLWNLKNVNKLTTTRLPIREYQCDNCNKWHLTGRPKNIKYIKNRKRR
jgi:hypothetical protein